MFERVCGIKIIYTATPTHIRSPIIQIGIKIPDQHIKMLERDSRNSHMRPCRWHCEFPRQLLHQSVFMFQKLHHPCGTLCAFLFDLGSRNAASVSRKLLGCWSAHAAAAVAVVPGAAAAVMAGMLAVAEGSAAILKETCAKIGTHAVLYM